MGGLAPRSSSLEGELLFPFGAPLCEDQNRYSISAAYIDETRVICRRSSHYCLRWVKSGELGRVISLERPRSGMCAFQDGKLLAQGEVLQHEAPASAKNAKYSSEPEPIKVEHGGKV